MSSSGGRRLPWPSSSASSAKGAGTQKRRANAAVSGMRGSLSSQSPHAIGSSQNPIPLTTPSPTGSDAERKQTSITSPSSKRRKLTGKAPIAVPPPPVGLYATGLLASDFAPPHFDLDDLENDNAAALEIVDLTQSDEGQDMPFMGSTLVKVVGVRYYDGYATPGEQVLLKRERHNPHDKNAIQVLSVVQRQIGHIPRTMAAKLAPLMDSRQIHLEGVVTGKKGTFELPIRVDLYATSEDEASQARITEELQRGGISFTIESTIRRDDLRMSKQQIMQAETRNLAQHRPSTNIGPLAGPSQGLGGPLGPLGLHSQPNNAHLLTGFGHQVPLIPVIEDLVQASQRFTCRDFGNAVEKFGLSEAELEKMPQAMQPEGLSISLLPYQLQGLKWLLEHESPVLPVNTDQSVQFWKRSSVHSGLFINTATMFSQNDPPHLASGGILADDMGLGKTVQMISLMLSDLEKHSESQLEESGTLIVAPLSVMSNWEQQIEAHIRPERALKVHRFHGAGKGKKAELNSFDVVITSYGTLTSEFDSFKKNKKSSSIYKKKWRRIILDEAHQIRNPTTKASLASMEITAKSRWALTGTPIVNNLKDLFSLIRFLGFSGGLADLQLFTRLFIRPLNEGDPQGTVRLQAVMGSICLRRKKDMKFVNLDIPELKEYIHQVKFAPEEKEKYDVLESEAKGLLERYENSKNPRAIRDVLYNPQTLNPSLWQVPTQVEMSGSADKKPENAYNNLLERLLRMRQMCNHPQLCGSARIQAIEARLAEIVSAGMSDEMRHLLQEILQLAIDSQEDCPICLETLHNPRITVCKHVFGLECITRVVEMHHKCPLCRADLPDVTGATIVEPFTETKPKLTLTLEDGTLLPPSSSKINAMITILQATQHKDPTSKTIVFSQWTKFLDIVSPHLTFAGLRFCRIDGTMPVAHRDRAISRLTLQNDHPDAVDVMLASLGVASVGLNLVAANQVILADSWWAPAIEDQAVDRVHRLGQRRETAVWRLVVENSIEQRVLQVQEMKRKLVSQAFKDDEENDAEGTTDDKNRKKRRGKGKETRLADLQMLLRG